MAAIIVAQGVDGQRHRDFRPIASARSARGGRDREGDGGGARAETNAKIRARAVARDRGGWPCLAGLRPSTQRTLIPPCGQRIGPWTRTSSSCSSAIQTPFPPACRAAGSGQARLEARRPDERLERIAERWRPLRRRRRAVPNYYRGVGARGDGSRRRFSLAALG